MQYSYGYRFLQNQKKEKVIKKIAFFSGLLLIFQMSLGSLFFNVPFLSADTENMCEADIDVVLIMDRSESMSDGEILSKCE